MCSEEEKEKQCEVSPPTVKNHQSSFLAFTLHLKANQLDDGREMGSSELSSKCSPTGPPVIFTSAIGFLVQKQLSRDIKEELFLFYFFFLGRVCR